MIVKTKQHDADVLKRLVYKHGITDVLLMLSDIWRFSNKARGTVIYRTLIDAREHIIKEERHGNRPQTDAVQVTESNPPARPDVALD